MPPSPSPSSKDSDHGATITIKHKKLKLSREVSDHKDLDEIILQLITLQKDFVAAATENRSRCSCCAGLKLNLSCISSCLKKDSKDDNHLDESPTRGDPDEPKGVEV